MNRLSLIAALISSLLVLGGCEEFLEAYSGYSARYEYELGFDACDRQAQICYQQQRSVYGNTYACQAQVNRCFARVYNNAEAAGVYFSLDYYFYGRSGYWSPRRGFIYGPHGRQLTIDRYRGGGGYTPRYDPYGYDDPYDCYGYRRASYCDDYYYRDRDRRGRDYRRGDRDRDGDSGDRGGRGDGGGNANPPPAPDPASRPRPPSTSPVTPPSGSGPTPSRPDPSPGRNQPRAEPPPPDNNSRPPARKEPAGRNPRPGPGRSPTAEPPADSDDERLPR